MSVDEQDRDLQARMRKVLEFARVTLPESIIAIFSFTQALDGSSINLEKVASNCQDVGYLAEKIGELTTRMQSAEVYDLTDTNGTMQ